MGRREVGQPRGNRLRKAHVGWDFDIHNDPRGGKFDSTAILKSWEDLGMSDEWCATLVKTQNSFERVSRVQGGLNESYEGVLCCILSKNVVFMPSSALSLKFYNIRYFSFNFEFERRHSYKSSIRSNLLRTYMPSLDSARPKFSIFAVNPFCWFFHRDYDTKFNHLARFAILFNLKHLM